jgi:malate synthase
MDARRGLIVVLAADAFRRRKFAVGAPREEPSLHILVLDVVTRFYLTVGLADFRQHLLLVANIRLDRVRNEVTRASA